ncbi:MAG: hypothetical protein EOP35_11715, partial [Rubrivivax sp.]
MTDALLTWLCSYLLHSSLLIGALWAAERAGWLAKLANGTQETLWRLALLGGLLSASLPLLSAVPAVPAVPSASPARSAPFLASRPEPAVVTVDALPPASVAALSPAGARPGAQLGALPITASLAPTATDVAVGFVAVWLLGAVLMLAALTLQWAWLRRVVRRLPALADPRWQALAASVCADMAVRRPSLRHARPGWASSWPSTARASSSGRSRHQAGRQSTRPGASSGLAQPGRAWRSDGRRTAMSAHTLAARACQRGSASAGRRRT